MLSFTCAVTIRVVTSGETMIETQRSFRRHGVFAIPYPGPFPNGTEKPRGLHQTQNTAPTSMAAVLGPLHSPTCDAPLSTCVQRKATHIRRTEGHNNKPN